VTVLAGPAFEAAFGATGAPDQAEIATTAALLRALGLLRPGQRLGPMLAAADREGALGFYSPERRELVVRGGRRPPCSAARSSTSSPMRSTISTSACGAISPRTRRPRDGSR
jgi:hypothetical protein